MDHIGLVRRGLGGSLSLTISNVADALLLAHDQQWFRDLIEFVTPGVALVARYWIYGVFPFDFWSRKEFQRTPGRWSRTGEGARGGTWLWAAY